MNEITVLSLFDGISCGQQALERVGIKVDTYYASEIEKQPIVATQYNYPNTIQLGDVTKVYAKDLKPIDLLIGGSPCQGFSRAGKNLNFEDPRSKLFFEYVRLLKECREINPNVKFLLENVEMDSWCLGVISEHLGLFPVKINAALVSAQNRVRWYWSNICTREEGFFNEVHTDIPQPKDRGIILRDILQPEEQVLEKYYFSDKIMKRLNVDNVGFVGFNKAGKDTNKSASLLARDYKGMSTQGINIVKTEGKARTVRSGGRGSIDKHAWDVIKIAKDGTLKENQAKAEAFCGGGNSGGNHSDMDLFIIASRGRGDNNEQQLEPRKDSKSIALTSVSKDNLVATKNYVQFDISGKGYKSQQDRAYYEESKMAKLPSSRAENKVNVLLNDYRIRRLTPIEVCRLQSMRDNYFYNSEGKNIISDSAIYKACGNGWNIEVIAHIFSFYKP